MYPHAYIPFPRSLAEPLGTEIYREIDMGLPEGAKKLEQSDRDKLVYHLCNELEDASGSNLAKRERDFWKGYAGDLKEELIKEKKKNEFIYGLLLKYEGASEDKKEDHELLRKYEEDTDMGDC